MSTGRMHEKSIGFSHWAGGKYSLFRDGVCQPSGPDHAGACDPGAVWDRGCRVGSIWGYQETQEVTFSLNGAFLARPGFSETRIPAVRMPPALAKWGPPAARQHDSGSMGMPGCTVSRRSFGSFSATDGRIYPFEPQDSILASRFARQRDKPLPSDRAKFFPNSGKRICRVGYPFWCNASF